MTNVPRRSTIVGALLLVLIGWSWRSPARTQARPLFLADNLPAVQQARVVADSVFALRGTMVDSMYLQAPQTLVVVLPQGAHRTPIYFAEGTCAGGATAWQPTRRIAGDLYRLYGAHHNIARIEVHLPQVSAVDGGWGWRTSCGKGPDVMGFERRELDSLSEDAS